MTAVSNKGNGLILLCGWTAKDTASATRTSAMAIP